MSDDQDGGIAFVRIHQRGQTGVHTYQAVPRSELAAVLAGAGDRTVIESCDVVLPIPSVTKLAADLATWRQQVTGGAVTIGTVAGGVWITGPLAGQPAPRGFEWYG